MSTNTKKRRKNYIVKENLLKNRQLTRKILKKAKIKSKKNVEKKTKCMSSLKLCTELVVNSSQLSQRKKATFSYPLHAIGPNIFTQTKWVARTGIRKPKSKKNYQIKVVDLQKV